MLPQKGPQIETPKISSWLLVWLMQDSGCLTRLVSDSYINLQSHHMFWLDSPALVPLSPPHLRGTAWWCINEQTYPYFLCQSRPLLTAGITWPLFGKCDEKEKKKKGTPCIGAENNVLLLFHMEMVTSERTFGSQCESMQQLSHWSEMLLAGLRCFIKSNMIPSILFKTS